MQSRYKGPSNLSSIQKEIVDEIIQTRPGTGIKGPFGPWLANPQLAQVAQRFGRIVRYETDLTRRESEMIILLTAKNLESQTEWDIHEVEARQCGLSEDIINRIKTNEPIIAPLKFSVLYNFTLEVLKTKTASDETYIALEKEFTDKQIVEIVSIIGYYTLVGLTLNVFQINYN